MSFGQPMLAFKGIEDNQTLAQYAPLPSLVSFKIDGVRLFGYDGEGYSRSLKTFPNQFIQDWVYRNRIPMQFLDGEIVQGLPYGEGVMQRAQSFTNSNYKEAPFNFYVFDWFGNMSLPVEERQKIAREMASKIPEAIWVEQVPCHSVEEILALEELALSTEYEGIIGRKPGSPYRHGRPGKRELYMWKLKRVEDSEAEIIGFEEELFNGNEEGVNELGRMKRQSLKENMVGKDTLGSFICKDSMWPKTFNVGTGRGLTHALRQEIWDNREKYIGKKMTYTFFRIGSVERPRFPKWKAFRHDI